jgi:hypothetical protein
VRLVNRNEAALKIKGPGGTETERVGVTLTLKAKGVYKIKWTGTISSPARTESPSA